MFLGSKVRPVRGADNLTAVYEPIVYTMWHPQHLTSLYASTACYGDNLLLFSFIVCKANYNCSKEFYATRRQESYHLKEYCKM
jgi:hypothetical protein